MGLISMKCPACGAVLENVDESREFFFCTYCGNKITYEKQRIEMTGEVSLAGVATAKSLLMRGTNALEDGKFGNAVNFFDRALDSDPRSAEAYMGKLAARNSCRRDTDLQQLPVRYTRTDESQPEDDNMILYRRALQYAKGDLRSKYEWINGPYHVAICELHEATGNIKNLEDQMNREHNSNLSTLRSTLDQKKISLASTQESLRSARENFSHTKKNEWGIIVKPLIFFVILLVISLYFNSRHAAPWLTVAATGAAFIAFLVTVIKSFVAMARVNKSYTRQNMLNRERDLSLLQQEVPQAELKLKNYTAKAEQEKAQFQAYANSILQPLADKVRAFREQS